MKHLILGGILSLVLTAPLMAHGGETHKDPRLERQHMKQEIEALEKKSDQEVWQFIDARMTDLADAIKSYNTKRSKVQLIQLKKSIDIIKGRVHHAEMMHMEKDHGKHEHGNH